MDKVRIGFVGVGHMGQAAHLMNFATLPECEVVAIAEVRKELRERVAARWGVARTYADHAEMMDKENLDAVVASQQFGRHGVLIPDLARWGKPIMIEKPLASSVEAGERVVEALKKAGTWLMVGYHKRSDPAVVYAKEEIDRLKASGELGSMRYVRISMPPGEWTANGFFMNVKTDEPVPATLEKDPPPDYMDQAAYGEYLEFVNYYIHQVNLMRHLMGEDYEVRYVDPTQTVIAVESASGVPGIIEAGAYKTTRDWQESALTTFERGWIEVEMPGPVVINRPGRVTVFKDPVKGEVPFKTEPVLPCLSAMRCQAMNFIKAVRGECAPTCTAEESLKDLISANQYLAKVKAATN